MTPTEPRIAPLTLAHLSALCALECACFADGWSVGLLEEELTCATGFARGLWVGDDLLAYALLRVVAQEAELLRIATSLQRRGQGLAGALLRDCQSQLASQGCTALFLEVRESNLAARTLYQRAGFFEVGRRNRYYQDPEEAALLLRCDL